MNLCDIQTVKEILSRHGFHFSKSKGQNFLIQTWVPENIVKGASIDDSCGVLEVGPGIGCLTNELSKRAGKVVTVELDEALRPVLAETLSECSNVEVIFGDILKQNLTELLNEHFPDLRRVAVANLPYYITTPILSMLLESGQFESVTVMVQKEVAQRICAAPGTSDYGAFSVFCQYYSIPKIIFEVPSSCFIPAPKVTSAVVSLEIPQEPIFHVNNEAVFFRTVHGTFASRRKTLLNSLSIAYPSIKKDALATVLSNCGFNSTVRGETLGIPDFICISNEIEKVLSL